MEQKVKVCIYCGSRYTRRSVLGPYTTSEIDSYCSDECVGAELGDMNR